VQQYAARRGAVCRVDFVIHIGEIGAACRVDFAILIGEIGGVGAALWIFWRF